MLDAGETKREFGSKARLPPALNPESLALVQPWRDWVSRGLITIKVEFSGGGTVVQCIPDESLVPGCPGTTPGQVKEKIIELGLWTPKGTKANPKKKEQEAPKRTLVKSDFKLPKEKLLARVSAVAEALTDTKARGRIGSLNYMVKGVDSFDKWWSVAPPDQKTRLLSDGRNFKTFGNDDFQVMKDVVTKCPFRGPVPTPKEEEEEGEEE